MITNYTIVSSYGGIIPRIILSPVGEIFGSAVYGGKEVLGVFTGLGGIIATVIGVWGPPVIPFLLGILKPNSEPDVISGLEVYMIYIGEAPGGAKRQGDVVTVSKCRSLFSSVSGSSFNVGVAARYACCELRSPLPALTPTRF